MDDQERLRRLRNAKTATASAMKNVDDAIDWARLVSESTVDELPAIRSRLAEYHRKVSLAVELIERHGVEGARELLARR